VFIGKIKGYREATKRLSSTHDFDVVFNFIEIWEYKSILVFFNLWVDTLPSFVAQVAAPAGDSLTKTAHHSLSRFLGAGPGTILFV
jgi:hypothetical protein